MTDTFDTEQTLSEQPHTVLAQPAMFSAAPPACSLLAALVALLVLAGWSAHAYALVTVLPRLPAMAQATATAFLFASASLWLLGGSVPGRISARVGRVLALAALLVGLGTLLRYGAALLGQISLPPAGGAGHPINRMSPNTALNFVLLGLALVLTDVRGRGDRWPAQALCLIVGLNALVALVGQVYGVTFLYGLSPYLGMAVHTATLFLILSLGLLLARPDRGFIAIVLSDDAAGRAARRFLPLALAGPIVLGGVGLLGQRLHSPNAPFLAYLFVVASIGLLGWLVWGNVLALAAQVRRAQSYERQVSDLERGRVEDVLNSTKQRLVFAVESAGIGTWHWDIPANVLVWSDRCKELFGISPEATMTRTLFYERIHPDDRPRAEATIADALAQGSPYDIEYRIQWPDGTVHWVGAKGQGYKDAAGCAVRFEGAVQDIDERKRAGERQRQFLRDVLASVTEGRLILCDTPDDLPAPLAMKGKAVTLSQENGLRELRHRALEAAEGMSEERRHDLVTAVSEAGMNTITHGGGVGTASVGVGADGTVQVRIADHGEGIALTSLPKATLARGFSTKASLGHGFKMMQQVDRVYVLTGPGGTTVVLEQGKNAAPPPWL